MTLQWWLDTYCEVKVDDQFSALYVRVKQMPKSGRVLLVSMPLTNPFMPSLAIEQLAATCRARSLECDVLYGSLLLSRSVPLDLIQGMAKTDLRTELGISGGAIFSSAYFGLESSSLASDLAESAVESPDPADGRLCELKEMYIQAIESANRCLDRCFEAFLSKDYDIVGFSVAFDAQKIASAALAKRIKNYKPDARVIFGGTGCDGPMGSALLERFPEIDILGQGDCLGTFPELIVTIRNQGSLPVGYSTQANRTSQSCDVQLSAGFLGTAVDVDYTQYVDQKAISEYAEEKLVLMLESSRGCWWGQKHHCTFCGIRSIEDGYRSAPSSLVVDQLLRLEQQYKPYLIYFTDSILDMGYLKSLLPTLSRLREAGELTCKLFYECKTNMTASMVALLASAGVLVVQPGIESFSTSILRLINKGCTGIQQVAFLKYAQAYGITPIYGLLVGIPGETESDLNLQIDLAPLLHHLPPPQQVNRLDFHKFSPYERNSRGYGFRNLRPFPVQRIMYQCADSLLARLCYELNYELDYSSDAVIKRERAYSNLSEQIALWNTSYLSGTRMVITGRSGDRRVVQRTATGLLEQYRLSKLEEDICENSFRPCKLEKLVSFSEADPIATKQVIADLVERHVLLHLDDSYLCLAIPTKLDCDLASSNDLSRLAFPNSRRDSLVAIQ
jgi:ribosomal peptide maturation radical SAM protein 1